MWGAGRSGPPGSGWSWGPSPTAPRARCGSTARHYLLDRAREETVELPSLRLGFVAGPASGASLGARFEETFGVGRGHHCVHRARRWRRPRAVHDPGKILLDVAMAVALGGDRLADIAMLRCEPAVFGPVVSAPTVSRLSDTLAASGEKALQAIRSARSEVRHRAWSLAGENAPDADGRITVGLDGVLVIAHSDKQDATATWKKTYDPLTAFVDHGPGGTGEPVVTFLGPGNAGSNTAADHITTAQLALARMPKRCRRGRPAQPAPARHRPEPGLAGDRPDRVRPAGLDAHARPDRPGEARGTASPAVPPVLRSRPARHHRPAQDSPPRPAPALDRRDHRRP